MFNPDGVPDFFPGTTPDVVSLTGTELQRIGAQIRTTGVDVNSAFEHLKGCYQAPEASTLITSMRPMKLLASDFGNDIATMGAILEQFGQDMKGPYDQLQQMLDRARVFVAKCNQSPDWRSYENWVDEENSYHVQTAQLLQTMMNIQVAAANQIEAIIGGLGWWPDDFQRQTPGLRGGLGFHPKVMQGGDPETPPWGSPEEWDMPWIGDVGKAVVGVLDGLTTLVGLQWLAQSTGWKWDDDFFNWAFDHPPADMHQMFDAWGEMGMDTLMLLNKVPGIRQALPDDMSADMDTRFNDTIHTIGSDWSKGDQTASVLGVLGLIPVGPTKLAGMTSKLGKLGKVGKLASKVPPVRIAVAGADKFLGFRAKIRAGAIEGTLKIPVVGAVVKGYSHIPILGKSVRLDPHVPLSRAPRIDTPTVHAGAPSLESAHAGHIGLESAHPGHIDLPTAHPTTSNHNRWSTNLPEPSPTHSGSVQPSRTGSVDPTHAGSIDPTHPGSVDPTRPGTVDPVRPGTVDPVRPGTDPNRPGSTDPTRPGSTSPGSPNATDPNRSSTTNPATHQQTEPVVPVNPTPVGTPPAAHSANTPGSSTTPNTPGTSNTPGSSNTPDATNTRGTTNTPTTNTPGTNTSGASNTSGVTSRPERLTTGPGRGSENPTTPGHTDGTSQQPGAGSHDHGETQPAAHQPHPDPHETTDSRTTPGQHRADDQRRSEGDRQAAEQHQSDEQRRTAEQHRADAQHRADEERQAEAQRQAEAERQAQAQRQAEAERQAQAQRQAEAERRGDGRSGERDGAGRGEVDGSHQGDGRTDDPGRETQPGSTRDEPAPAVAPVQPAYPMQPASMHHAGAEPSIASRLEPNRPPASTTPDRPRQDPARAGRSNDRSIADALDPDRVSGRRVEGDRVESDRLEGEGLQKPQHPAANHDPAHQPQQPLDRRTTDPHSHDSDPTPADRPNHEQNDSSSPTNPTHTNPTQTPDGGGDDLLSRWARGERGSVVPEHRGPADAGPLRHPEDLRSADPEWDRLTPGEKYERASAELGRDARTFADENDAKRWAEQHWDQYSRDLTSHQQGVVEQFTRGGEHVRGSYTQVGEHLRGHGVHPELDPDIEELDRILDGHRVPETVVVSRVTDVEHFDVPVRELAGTTFRDPSFLSTSVGEAISSRRLGIMHIKVPEGTPALYTGRHSAHGDGERELVLGRELPIAISRVVQHNGKFHIFGEVVLEPRHLSATELDRLPAPDPALRHDHQDPPTAAREVPRDGGVDAERTQPISGDDIRRHDGVPEDDPFAGSELADRGFRASTADHQALARQGGMERGKLGEIRERLERQAGDANALSETEVTSLERMLIGHDHQDVNEAFRDGDRSVEQKPVVRVATSALNKLPDFHGEVRRGIRFYSADEFARFMDRYQPGRTTTEPAFTHSARAADRTEGSPDKGDFSAAEDFAGLGEGDGRVVLHIDSQHGKDLSFMRDPHLGVNEVVHGPHTPFYPTAKPYRDEHGVWHVHARDHGGPVDPTPEHLDRTAGDRPTARVGDQHDRGTDEQSRATGQHGRRDETDPERTQQIATDDSKHLDARPGHDSGTSHRQSINPSTQRGRDARREADGRRDADTRPEANQPDETAYARDDRSRPDPERTQRISADDSKRHDSSQVRDGGTPDKRSDDPNRNHNPNTRHGRDAQREADGRRDGGTPDSERTRGNADVRHEAGGRGGADGAPGRRPGDQSSHHEPKDSDDTQPVPHEHIDPDDTQQVPQQHVDGEQVPEEHVGGAGKKEPYVASGTPDWAEIVKDEHLEVQEPTERSRRGRRRVKDNWLAERFGPREHTLDREVGLEKLPMYGDPGVPRGERDSVRYNPVDEGGKHQAALEQNVGPQPLQTVPQWKNLVNPNHAKGWVEFKMNCSAVTRAVVDIIQGRRIRIADGDFQKSPLDHTTPWPGDYDDTYEWMGVRGPGYRMDRHLPPGHPDPVAHQLAFTQNAYHSVEAGLTGRPPGTVAAICVRWAPDGGHWFAAYVDPHGKVRHLDAQPAPDAIDLPWPPVYGGQLDRLEYTIREPDGDWEGANSADPQSTW